MQNIIIYYIIIITTIYISQVKKLKIISKKTIKA